MVEEFDIINLDNKIKDYFQNELKNIIPIEEELKELTVTFNNLNSNQNLHSNILNNISININNLKEKLEKLRKNEDLTTYISKTASYIEDFRLMLNTPIKISFFKKKTVSETSNTKTNIIINYINAIKYLNLNDSQIMKEIQDAVLLLTNTREEKTEVCLECKSELFDETERYKICKSCGSQEEIISYMSSYKDANRVNISTKYVYDREIHFRDCMNQYQGKQNCHIEQKVYDDLEREFKNYGLIVEGALTNQEKFVNITRSHVSSFLRDLHYTKHYENAILIHYNMTGKPPDNIKHLEDTLREEFNMLVEMYDKLYAKDNTKRKNFISTHLTLYQLLLKHGHKCNKEDFIMLKTTERKSAHLEILRNLFTELGFEFINS